MEKVLYLASTVESQWKNLPAKHGFLNFSGDFRYRMPTHRGGEYLGTVYYNIPANTIRQDSERIIALDNKKIQERGFSRKTPVSNDGNIKLSGFGFLVNGAYPVNSKVELFWTGSINYRYAVNQGAYRFPKTITQVNTDLFPDGFKTEPVINSRDISAIAGAGAKQIKDGIGNGTVHTEKIQISRSARIQIMHPSISLGANAPTEFYGGKPAFRQQINYYQLCKRFGKTNRHRKNI